MNVTTGKTGVALVTGGRRGIGRASAFALADSGFDVVINDLERDDAAEQTLQGIGERGRRALFVQGDLADLDQHERIVREAQALGSLTCLLNNAGVQTKHRGDILETPPESFDRLMSINLRASFFLTQRVAKQMRDDDRGDRTRPTRSVIFISSGNAVIATAAQAEYCISKAGVAMVSTLYAMRLAEYGIAVHEVRPGIIQTDMTKDVFDKYNGWVEAGGFPMARWGQAEDVGRTVAELASGRMPYSTGHAYFVDGGMHIRRT
jgi:NAD(P)-dependent dehydrogenase (short-subunit alcohol dehydrogenase family)